MYRTASSLFNIGALFCVWCGTALLYCVPIFVNNIRVSHVLLSQKFLKIRWWITLLSPNSCLKILHMGVYLWELAWSSSIDDNISHFWCGNSVGIICVHNFSLLFGLLRTPSGWCYFAIWIHFLCFKHDAIVAGNSVVGLLWASPPSFGLTVR